MTFLQLPLLWRIVQHIEPSSQTRPEASKANVLDLFTRSAVVFHKNRDLTRRRFQSPSKVPVYPQTWQFQICITLPGSTEPRVFELSRRPVTSCRSSGCPMSRIARGMVVRRNEVVGMYTGVFGGGIGIPGAAEETSGRCVSNWGAARHMPDPISCSGALRGSCNSVNFTCCSFLFGSRLTAYFCSRLAATIPHGLPTKPLCTLVRRE